MLFPGAAVQERIGDHRPGADQVGWYCQGWSGGGDLSGTANSGAFHRIGEGIDDLQPFDLNNLLVRFSDGDGRSQETMNAYGAGWCEDSGSLAVAPRTFLFHAAGDMGRMSSRWRTPRG